MKLLNISGGVDSVYVAWDHLRNRRGRLLLHHCEFRTKSRRWEAEAKALNEVLAWFDANGLTDYEIARTGFDYGTLDTIWDIEVIGFLTGVILRKRPEINTVLLTATADDMELKNISRRQKRRADIIELVANRPVRLIQPVSHVRKAAMIAELPADLYALTWSCRKPKDGKPCGKCYTCRTIAGTYKP